MQEIIYFAMMAAGRKTQSHGWKMQHKDGFATKLKRLNNAGVWSPDQPCELNESVWPSLVSPDYNLPITAADKHDPFAADVSLLKLTMGQKKVLVFPFLLFDPAPQIYEQWWKLKS